MYVHREKGLAYLANPRTASRATAKALMGIGFVMVGDHHAYDRGRAGAWTFCTVRNVASTLASWGRHMNTSDLPTILSNLFRTDARAQRAIVEGWEDWTLFPHAEHSQVILHYENLHVELNELLGDHGLPPVTLEWVE